MEKNENKAKSKQTLIKFTTNSTKIDKPNTLKQQKKLYEDINIFKVNNLSFHYCILHIVYGTYKLKIGSDTHRLKHIKLIHFKLCTITYKITCFQKASHLDVHKSIYQLIV